MNVSARSVESAVQVVKHGTPETVEAVKQGKVAVSAAARTTKEANRTERERDDDRHFRRREARSRIPASIPRGARTSAREFGIYLVPRLTQKDRETLIEVLSSGRAP